MPLVLMLAMVAGVLLAAAYERQSSQRRVVERQLVEYRRHHEVFGIRAILAKWKQSMDVQALEELATIEEADEQELAFGFDLPSGARVRVYVRDGQGAALATPPESVPADIDEIYRGMLRRLPEAPGNRRIHGPWQISANSAPEAVLEALSPREGEELAERILREREDGAIDGGRLEPLIRLSITREFEREAITQILTTDPAIWMLDIHVLDEQGERRFAMLLQGLQSGAGTQSGLSTLQWYEIPLQEAGAKEGGVDRRREGGSERNE